MSLTVYNDDSVLNVDSHYNNLALYRKINKSQLQSLGNQDGFYRPTTDMDIHYNDFRRIPDKSFNKYRYRIPSFINAPIAAISRVAEEPFSGGIHTINGNRYVTVYTSYTGDFDIYLFSTNRSNNENYGLEVFNEQGEKVFDSENKYLNILPQLTNSKTCALVLHGAVIAEATLRGTGTNFVRHLWSFAVRQNQIVKVKYYQKTFYRHYNLWRDALPVPLYDNTPLIIDVSNY